MNDGKGHKKCRKFDFLRSSPYHVRVLIGLYLKGRAEGLKIWGANYNTKAFYGTGFVKIWVGNCPFYPESNGHVPTPRLPPDTI